MKTYETEHLLLRAFTENDLDDDYAIVRDFENIQYLLMDAQTKE